MYCQWSKTQVNYSWNIRKKLGQSHTSKEEMYKKSGIVEPVVNRNWKTWEETKTSSKVTMYINVKVPLLQLYALTSAFHFLHNWKSNPIINLLIVWLAVNKQTNNLWVEQSKGRRGLSKNRICGSETDLTSAKDRVLHMYNVNKNLKKYIPVSALTMLFDVSL